MTRSQSGITVEGKKQQKKPEALKPEPDPVTDAMRSSSKRGGSKPTERTGSWKFKIIQELSEWPVDPMQTDTVKWRQWSNAQCRCEQHVESSV